MQRGERDEAAGGDYRGWPVLPGAEGEAITLLMEQLEGLCRDLIAPQAPETDRSGDFPKRVVEQLGSMGLLGMMVPEEFGGAGMSSVAYVS